MKVYGNRESIVNDPFVIGISGSIGSGKSLVRHLLAMRGIMPLDADELTHFLLAKGKAGYQQVVQVFGESYLDESGNLDRARLGMDVFRDPRSLQKLESILHPLVSQTVRAILQQTASPFVALEAIKLYSSDLLQVCDSRWFVTVTTAAQKERLKRTRSMDEEAIHERLHQQQFPKEMSVDHYIENSCHLNDAAKQIDIIWEEMKQETTGMGKVDEDPAAILSIPILGVDAIEAVNLEIQRDLMKNLPVLPMMGDDTFLQRVILSRTFLSPCTNSHDFLIWQFDHFNTHVQFLRTDMDHENLQQGLERLENQSIMWGGNCVVVKLDEYSIPFKHELLSMGYHIFSQGDITNYPFLIFSFRNKGKIGDHLVKILPGGIWRLIP